MRGVVVCGQLLPERQPGGWLHGVLRHSVPAKREPVALAERLAFAVAVHEPEQQPEHVSLAEPVKLDVGAERQPERQPKRLALALSFDVAVHEPERQPEHVAFDVSKRVAVLVPVELAKRVADVLGDVRGGGAPGLPRL